MQLSITRRSFCLMHADHGREEGVSHVPSSIAAVQPQPQAASESGEGPLAGLQVAGTRCGPAFPPVACPNWPHLSDDDVFGARLGLKDAQRALAVEYGFADWEALKRHVESVSSGRRGEIYPEGDLPEPVAAIFKAVEDGEVDKVRELLDADPGLVHVRVLGATTRRGIPCSTAPIPNMPTMGRILTTLICRWRSC